MLPLKAIIERVEGNYPGAIVEVELEREDGRWQYEIKLLRRGGSLLKIKVDARDGSVLGVKGRPGDGRAERSRRRDDERAGVEPVSYTHLDVYKRQVSTIRRVFSQFLTPVVYLYLERPSQRQAQRLATLQSAGNDLN